MRYTLKASNAAGRVEFQERRTIDAALKKASELQDAGFRHITLVNVESGVEITDLEEFIRSQDLRAGGSQNEISAVKELPI